MGITVQGIARDARGQIRFLKNWGWISLLKWNVYVSNFNQGIIETHNVFDHTRFMDDCKKAARKYSKDREAFEEAVKKSLMYNYWSKCEWELILDHWPHKNTAKELKIDVYDQVILNWDKFADYVWNHAVELRRPEKKVIRN